MGTVKMQLTLCLCLELDAWTNSDGFWHQFVQGGAAVGAAELLPVCCCGAAPTLYRCSTAAQYAPMHHVVLNGYLLFGAYVSSRRVLPSSWWRWHYRADQANCSPASCVSLNCLPC